MGSDRQQNCVARAASWPSCLAPGKSNQEKCPGLRPARITPSTVMSRTRPPFEGNFPSRRRCRQNVLDLFAQHLRGERFRQIPVGTGQPGLVLAYAMGGDENET